jgi:hypothetical protein
MAVLRKFMPICCLVLFAGAAALVPDTAFLDESGVIVSRVQGEIKKAELLERLEWLTGDRKAPAPKALVRNLP